MHGPVSLITKNYTIIIIKNEFKLTSVITGAGGGQRFTSYCKREGTRRGA